MFQPYVHIIDPILGRVGGLYLWWYGLGYSLGFLEMFLFLKRHRDQLALSRRDVCTLNLFIVVGVLVVGRFIEVAFDEWPFYREHPGLIPAYWLGGMASHGVMLGAALSVVAFAFMYEKSLLNLADAIVIPGALLMGMGRIGNFIDGQIVGALTDVAWGVQFPDVEGFRHPVVLYDGAKNLLLIPYLLWVRKMNPTPGATAARFVFWYAFLRIFIDLFRDYPTHRLVLGTGQTLNLLMVLLGVVLLVRSRLRRLGHLETAPASTSDHGATNRKPLLSQRIAFVFLVAFCLAMPSNWTQDVPARYGDRHPGLEHSRLYPKIDTTPRTTPQLRNKRWEPRPPGTSGDSGRPALVSLWQNAWIQPSENRNRSDARHDHRKHRLLHSPIKSSIAAVLGNPRSAKLRPSPFNRTFF